MKINLENYIPNKFYRRADKDCVLCHSRKKLIMKTPEELIRQAMVSYLIDKLKVPADLIEVEVPLSRLKKGSVGRVDIVVYETSKNRKKSVACIIECKSPDVLITDNVVEQIKRYDSIVGSKTAIATNGKEAKAYERITKKSQFTEISRLPSYSDMISPGSIPSIHYIPWERPAFKDLKSMRVLKEIDQYGWIGEDTTEPVKSFALNLAGLLIGDRTKAPIKKISNLNIVADSGLRYTTFGNAAGGSWGGEYRSFIVEDEEGSNQVVGLSIMSKQKVTNHPKWGNSKGHTMLLASIDDYENSHLSIELSLDNFTIFNHKNQTVEIWHNGTLTVGNLGRAKNAEVVDFVQKAAPDLVDKAGNIILGKLVTDRNISWDQKETRNFISNLIRYAIIRDGFRRNKKAKRK